jgi:hypothetical protein
MNRRYVIPAGSAVLVLRNTDAPDAWQAHTTRIALSFERPVDYTDPHGTLAGRLVFRRGQFLIAVPRSLFEQKPSTRKSTTPKRPAWQNHAVKWGELELIWLMPTEATTLYGL